MNKDEQQALERFIGFARNARGINLGSYKASFLLRRLRIRLDRQGVSSLEGYSQLLRQQPREWEKLIDSLSINVSKFLRDPEVYDFFRRHCLMPLIARKRLCKRRTIRLWSAGCSCGEEAYTLAILLRETLKEPELARAKIWASDVDNEALAVAQKGVYHLSSLKTIGKRLLDTYFEPVSSDTFRVQEQVKRLVTFRTHNLLTDEPFRFIDAVFFRNVRIYFSAAEGEKVLRTLCGALNPGGYLVIGKVEILPAPLRSIFMKTEGFHKIFQKIA